MLPSLVHNELFHYCSQ